MEDKILQFFELSQPCPAEINNCENIRLEYVTELNDLKRRGGCGTCIERKLRMNYIEKIKNQFNTA